MTRSVVVEPEIQAISDKFIAAFKKGDVQGITDLFAKDAVLLPNHAPRLKGQQAIAAHWKAGLEQLRPRFTYERVAQPMIGLVIK